MWLKFRRSQSTLHTRDSTERHKLRIAVFSKPKKHDLNTVASTSALQLMKDLISSQIAFGLLRLDGNVKPSPSPFNRLSVKLLYFARARSIGESLLEVDSSLSRQVPKGRALRGDETTKSFQSERRLLTRTRYFGSVGRHGFLASGPLDATVCDNCTNGLKLTSKTSLLS